MAVGRGTDWGSGETAGGGGGGGGAWMDNSLAELELIESCLTKTSSLTDKMSAMLSSFDKRLVKLESTMMPLHRSTQSLTTLNENMQRLGTACERILECYESADKEEAIIRRGIGGGQVEEYIASLSRLRDGVDYLGKTDLKGNERAMTRMSQLIKAGLLQLQGAFRATLEPHCKPVEALTIMSKRQGFPTFSAQAIKDLVSLLSLISSQDALQQTPNGMAAPLPSACQTYSEMRSKYLVSSLQNLGRASVATTEHRSGSIENGYYNKGSCGLVSYAEALLGMFEVENENCQLVFGRLEPKTLAKSIFEETVTAALTTFIETCREVNGIVKRQLTPPILSPQYPANSAGGGQVASALPLKGADLGAGLLALDVRSSLEPTVAELKALISTKDGGLESILHSNRGTCLSTLAETMEEVSSVAVRKQTVGPPPDGGPDEVIDRIIFHLEGLNLYKSTLLGLLEIMGDAAWSSKAQRTVMGRHDESGLVAQYVGDSLSTLLRSLDVRSKSFRRPLVGSVYMMNNIVLLMKRIKNGGLFVILQEDSLEYLERRLAAYQGEYLDCWKPAVEPLMDVTYVRSGTLTTKLGNISEKQVTKDRFRMFNEAMDEIIRAHQGLKLRDEATRQAIVRSLEKMVGVMYTRFIERHQNEPFSKNPAKYLRYSPSTMDQTFRHVLTGD